MRYIPLGNQLLLELHTLEKKVGGIIIPDGAEKDVWYGVVLEIGMEACKSIIKKGDKVFYNIYGAKELEKNKLIVVGISDILCVFEEDE
jgi:co-chaperonin GroES (HSP10)